MERKTLSMVCVCALSRTRKEGRKEGSKTWLTGDHRSRQDTFPPPPPPFFSVSPFYREEDSSIRSPLRLLLSFFSPLSSVHLARPVEKKRFPSAVGTKLWSRNCVKKGKTKSGGEEGRKNPRIGATRPNRRIERDQSFSSLSLFRFCPSWTTCLLLLLLLVITAVVESTFARSVF